MSLDIPKSEILTIMPVPTRQFRVATSLWTNLSVWRCSIPEAHCNDMDSRSSCVRITVRKEKLQKGLSRVGVSVSVDLASFQSLQSNKENRPLIMYTLIRRTLLFTVCEQTPSCNRRLWGKGMLVCHLFPVRKVQNVNKKQQRVLKLRHVLHIRVKNFNFCLLLTLSNFVQNPR